MKTYAEILNEAGLVKYDSMLMEEEDDFLSELDSLKEKYRKKVFPTLEEELKKHATYYIEEIKKSFKIAAAEGKDEISYWISLPLPPLLGTNIKDWMEVIEYIKVLFDEKYDIKLDVGRVHNKIKITGYRASVMIDEETEEVVYCSCGSTGVLEPCPYEEEMSGSDEDCNCCKDCRKNCVADI